MQMERMLRFLFQVIKNLAWHKVPELYCHWEWRASDIYRAVLSAASLHYTGSILWMIF